MWHRQQGNLLKCWFKLGSAVLKSHRLKELNERLNSTVIGIVGLRRGPIDVGLPPMVGISGGPNNAVVPETFCAGRSMILGREPGKVGI
jgi:hypothetical protein